MSEHYEDVVAAMSDAELVQELRNILPEMIPYGDMVGAPYPYCHQGPAVYPHQEDYFIEEAANRLERSIPVQQAWISVEDRLPEREGRYLCVKRIGKSGMVYVQLMNGDSYGFSMDHIYTDDVTHWMPLPEAPKEE